MDFIKVKFEKVVQAEIVIRRASDLYDFLKSQYGNQEQEYFLVIHLNAAHEPTRIHVVTKGTVNNTHVHPREVFREAIRDNSAAVIVAHNHQSGNVTPSKQDHEVTEMLVNAGKVIGIEVLDHVIISSRGFYSFRENENI